VADPGSGLPFLAMMFCVAGIGAGLEAAGTQLTAATVGAGATFAQMVLVTISKTYALRGLLRQP
jgi:hypothetical protein